MSYKTSAKARFRRDSPTALDLGERPLIERTATVRPWWLELVFMPPSTVIGEEVRCVFGTRPAGGNKPST